MNKVPESVRKELAALAKKPESEIDFSDIPETSASTWAGATRGQFYRPVKKSVTLRLDADVLEWLKSSSGDGEGYQTRVNKMLREAMLANLANLQKHPAEPTLATTDLMSLASTELFQSVKAAQEQLRMTLASLERWPTTLACDSAHVENALFYALSHPVALAFRPSDDMEKQLDEILSERPDVSRDRIVQEATRAAQTTAEETLKGVLVEMERRAKRHEAFPWE